MQMGENLENRSVSDTASAIYVPAKRHLIITGSRGIGKSTLLREILALPYFADSGPFPGFTTQAFPRDRVELTDNLTGEFVRIGFYNPKNPIAAETFSAGDFTPYSCAANRSGTDTKLPGTGHPAPQQSGNQMTPDIDGFLGLGLTAVTRAIDSASQWAVIDELGYLEGSCKEFCDAVFRLFDRKRVIAVLRSQSTPFLDALRAREDVFVYDLDHPVLPVGCVIMASGLGKRFGSNKLMADFNGKPLISQILLATAGTLFATRIVVTRSKEVEAFCRERNIPVLLHAMPYRNHTVHLGLSTLLKEHPELAGCMFALGDQPLLTRETLEAMTITFSQYDQTVSSIVRLADISKGGSVIPGNPILFGNRYFEELLTLPDNHGGNVLLKKYPDDVRYFPACSPLELADADTPSELEQLKKAELTR